MQTQEEKMYWIERKLDEVVKAGIEHERRINIIEGMITNDY